MELSEIYGLIWGEKDEEWSLERFKKNIPNGNLETLIDQKCERYQGTVFRESTNENNQFSKTKTWISKPYLKKQSFKW